MGHTTPKTTQRYIENNSEYHRTVVDELARRFAEQDPDEKTKKVATKVATKGISDTAAEITACVNSGSKAS
jgi:hypothetical protein